MHTCVSDLIVPIAMFAQKSRPDQDVRHFNSFHVDIVVCIRLSRAHGAEFAFVRCIKCVYNLDQYLVGLRCRSGICCFFRAGPSPATMADIVEGMGADAMAQLIRWGVGVIGMQAVCTVRFRV